MTYYNSEIKIKNKYSRKEKNYIKNYSEMSRDALIEEIQLKFITNFKRNPYEFMLNYLYKRIYFHFRRSSIR